MHVRRIAAVLALSLVFLLGARAGGVSAKLTPSGSVSAVGYNNQGQLGNGTTDINACQCNNTPGPVSGLSGVLAVTAGGFGGGSNGGGHSLALRSDGTVRAWGNNADGELGNGGTTDSNTPVPVSGLSRVVAVAAGGFHSLALKADGSVFAWGDDANGQLGIDPNDFYNNGVPAYSSTPVQVSGLSSVIAIAAGSDHNLALKADGTVVAWGYNDTGQLGNGTTTTTGCECISTPVPVSGLSGVVAVSGGGLHSLALKADGTVWAWGHTAAGQLGNNNTTTDSSIPVQVGGLSGVVAIAAGGFHNLALKADGTVWSWGNNDYGQLGNTTTTTTGCDCIPSPGPVSGMSGIVAIAAGAYHNLAIKADLSAWSWGNNAYGQLGNGTTNSSGCYCNATPGPVSGLSSAVVAIAGGGAHSLAVTAPAADLSLQAHPARNPLPVRALRSFAVDLVAQAPVHNLGAWTVDVLFDHGEVQPLTCNSAGAFVSQCNLQYAAGRVRVTGAAVGLPGRTVLASLTFQALKAAITPTIRLNPITLSDGNLQPLGALTQPLLLNVFSAADVDRDGRVDAVDASCAVHYVANPANTPGPCPSQNTAPVRNAGTVPYNSLYDVNMDNKVDITDALCVLLAITAQPPSPPACPAWAVVGTPDPAASVQAAAATPHSTSRVAWLRLTSSSTTVKHGDSISLTLSADVPAGLGGWTVDLKYDPKLLNVASCDAGDGFALCNPDFAPGIIRVVGASTAGERNPTLGTITFTATGPAGRTVYLTGKATTLVDTTGAPLSPSISGTWIRISK